MVYSMPERSSQSFEFQCVWKSFKEVLKMIDQPSGVLEYDAVATIDHKFREARKVKRAYGNATPKHIHYLHWQI
jgi:hypothetical protein